MLRPGETEKRFTWRRISLVLTAVVLIGTTIAVLKPYRFWAWATDLQQVAGVTYDTAVSWEQDWLRKTQLEIGKCEVNGNCPPTYILRLKRDEQETLDKIKKLREEQKSLLEEKKG